MTYRHDIFVSYKREIETLAWISEHFRPLLEHRVGLALGREPKIFIHEITHNLPVGAEWPPALAKEIAASRVLIPLWTKTFFNSRWCTSELAHMIRRQQSLGANAPILVMPMIIHDGDDFPPSLGVIQTLDIKACYNTRMHRNSRKAEQLSDLLDSHALSIAAAINAAPAWNAEWLNIAVDEFLDTYYESDVPAQSSVPRFT